MNKEKISKKMKKNMKKLVISLIFIIILISNRVTVFAGNIPGSLMHSEDAQIFFGKVLSYDPNEENQPIEVEILEVIKGNVKKDSKQTYFKADSRGEHNIRNGKVYLFIYYDEHNPLDVFEVTTYNTKTLKLKHAKGDMWERFENYLNEGKYGEAKIEGLMPYTRDIIDGILVFILIICAVIIIIKHKKLEKEDMKESKIITFIGGFYIFGGIVVLLSLIFNGSGLNTIFDVPNIPDYIVKLLVGIIYIPLGYLYINRIKNSNWIILALAIIFYCISASLTTEFNTQPFIGNLIYSSFVIVATIVRRKEFINSLNTIMKK